MLDFEVQRCTRRCAATGRELLPGESFYSVLLPEGSAVVRYDYALEAWSGPPEKAIGVWQSHIPEANATGVQWAPHEVLLQYFEQLSEDSARADERYVLALLLVRRRVLRLEDTETKGASETLVLYCGRNETEYRVAVALPTEDRARVIQEQLAQLLIAQGTP